MAIKPVQTSLGFRLQAEGPTTSMEPRVSDLVGMLRKRVRGNWRESKSHQIEIALNILKKAGLVKKRMVEGDNTLFRAAVFGASSTYEASLPSGDGLPSTGAFGSFDPPQATNDDGCERE